MTENKTEDPEPGALIGDRLQALMEQHGFHGAKVVQVDTGPPEDLGQMTDRQLLERVQVQLAYLVDVLSPHGRVVRAVDLVADTYGPQGPLFGRLDHADVQAHAIEQGLADVVAALRVQGPKLDRLDQFITDNQELIEQGRKMMGTTAALRRAMPGGGRHRPASSKP